MSLDTGNPNDLRDKFDIIFATYYIEPSRVRAIRPEDKKCIEEYRQKATEGEVDSVCLFWKKLLEKPGKHGNMVLVLQTQGNSEESWSIF